MSTYSVQVSLIGCSTFRWSKG